MEPSNKTTQNQPKTQKKTHTNQLISGKFFGFPHRPVRLGCFRCGFVCGCFCVLMICKFDSPCPNHGLKRASHAIADSAIHNAAIPIWLMSKCIQTPYAYECSQLWSFWYELTRIRQWRDWRSSYHDLDDRRLRSRFYSPKHKKKHKTKEYIISLLTTPQQKQAKLTG